LCPSYDVVSRETEFFCVHQRMLRSWSNPGVLAPKWPRTCHRPNGQISSAAVRGQKIGDMPAYPKPVLDPLSMRVPLGRARPELDDRTVNSELISMAKKKFDMGFSSSFSATSLGGGGGGGGLFGESATRSSSSAASPNNNSDAPRGNLRSQSCNHSPPNHSPPRAILACWEYTVLFCFMSPG
jgi:hypothetical protein